MHNPVISIIVPYFNSETYISKCVESILNQTFKDFELILIDDGSTDNGFSICKKYAKNDSRIVLLRKENGGQGTARNLGLNQSKGKYIGFVDSDDFIELNMYKLLYEKIEQYGADMSICGYNTFNKLNGKLTPYKYEHKEIVLDNKSLMQEYLTKTYITGGPCNKLYSREFFKDLRFPPIRIREDSYLMPHIFKEVNKAVFIGENLYNQFLRKGSTERSKFSLKQLDALKSVDSLEEVVSQNYPELMEYLLIRKIQTKFELMKNIILSKSIKEYQDIFHNLLSDVETEMDYLSKYYKITPRLHKNLILSKTYYYYYKCKIKLIDNEGK